MRNVLRRYDEATHGARVAAYVRCGEMEQAERALNAGRSDPRPNSRPSVYAYTALVQGLARVGKIEEARGWLDVMRGDGVPPNAYTYTGIVDGLVRVGDAAAAEAAVEAGLDTTTFHSLTHSLVFCSPKTQTQLMTASVFHVTNRVTPRSE